MTCGPCHQADPVTLKTPSAGWHEVRLTSVWLPGESGTRQGSGDNSHYAFQMRKPRLGENVSFGCHIIAHRSRLKS